ncbi:MAG: efflux RND transporter permease subunit [Planctomycetota bacterium]|jgi:predicted RND superfamily exporter protein
MARFETALGQWVVRQRWWLLLATLLLVSGSVSGLRFLSFNNDTRAFFSEENPQLQALEELEDTYDKRTAVLFVIAAGNGDVFTRETLSALEELTEAAWGMPHADRVNSLTNFQHTRAEGDDIIVEDLVQGAMALPEAELGRIRAITLSEPLLVNRLISPSGHVTGVHVNFLLPGDSLEEVPTVARAARQMADALRREQPGLEVHLVGDVMSDNAFGEASRNDMATLIPLMFLTLVVVVGFSLRAVTGTLSTLVVVLISMLTGMGVAGWLGLSITSASANAPTIILTLAVADSVHVLATLFREMRRGKTKHQAIAESLRINFQPVFLTSVTTAIGFLTMNFSDAPPFRDLGNIVSAGVLAALIYSIFFLPSLMAVIPVRVRPQAEARQQVFAGLSEFVIARRNPIFWWASLLIVALSAGTALLELNDDFIKYFSERYAIRRASDFMEDNLSGANVIEYSLESGEPDGINDPAYLAKLDRFASWYRQQPKVVHVSNLADTMKRLNKSMHGDDEAYYRIPERRDLASQYLLLYEMFLPAGLDLTNEINGERSATRMVATLSHANTRELREMDEKARAWLKANAPENMFSYGSGLSIIWAHISERNINSMLGASLGALALISLIMMFALRSFRLGSLSLIPNLAPAFMAFGVWGMLVGRAGLGLTIIAAMTIGVVVDDTVHFLSKYLRARREHRMSPAEAVRYSFRTVGMAMWITTAALVSGFMVLSLSGYKMNSEMGLMAAMTIAFAFVLDVVFLPALLMKADVQTARAPESSRALAVEPVAVHE